MSRVSNNLIGILNFITFLLSIPIIVAGVWLAHRGTTDCVRFLERPIIVIGVFLMLVSLAGLVGACFRVSWLLWMYLLVMFLLIVLLFCFTTFAFVVTNPGAGRTLSGRGYKEYRLGDYSNWLQKWVSTSRISSCLIDGNVCKSMAATNVTIAEFNSEHLSAIQSGCCKPPDECNFEYISPTVWTKTPSNSTNRDCSWWDNDVSRLCFNCDSCKAGFLDNVKSDWKKVAIINIIFLVLLVIVYSIGCCAFRNNRAEKAYTRNSGYP